jgi:hypothetical protein
MRMFALKIFVKIHHSNQFNPYYLKMVVYLLQFMILNDT